MKLFGLEITRQKALSGTYPVTAGTGGWTNLLREPFTGAWQRNLEVSVDTALSYTAVFSCIKLITSDISKLRLRLVAQDRNGIWTEVEANSPFWPVIRKPNRYQTTQQFIANWLESKLIHGNTYVLKAYDARPVVSQLYILNPRRVTVLCAPDGSVYYELRGDHLTGLAEEGITVPASEIIHDRWNTFYHPLIGTSPLTSAGYAAAQGLKIQENSTTFFSAGAQPGGLLIFPTPISLERATELKEYWNTNYGPGGPSVGRVAILGDGAQYHPMTMTAADQQIIDQLRMTAETVCSAFSVPKYMVGIGEPPAYNNIEALNQMYYSQCLQVLIENIEQLLDEGMALPKPLGTEFDTEDGLFRMDTKTKAETAHLAIQSGMSPNEVRDRYFDRPPVPGGETPYLQEQQWPLRHLADRPLPSERPITEPAPMELEDDADSADNPAAEDDDTARAVEEWLRDWEREAAAARAA